MGTFEAAFWKAKGVYNYIDKIICPSSFIKTKLDSNPLFKNKTVAIHNFVDSVKLPNTDEKGDYVLYFGRFSKEKGVKTLLEVCKELPEIQFVFAGGGPLEDLVNSIPNVKNVGFKTGDELKYLISNARFTVYPSEWYENCPFSVMESQIYSTPVIAADIGGIPELIKIGQTGELFESGNVYGLKKAVESLWNDSKRLNKYIENCKTVNFLSVKEYYQEIYNFL